MAEFSRGRLFARFAGFVIAITAVLLGAGASTFAEPRKNTSPTDKPDVAAQERQQERQTATLPRYFTINQVLANLDGTKANAAATNRPTQLAALDVSASATDAATKAVSVPSDEPFGLTTFRAPEGQLWVKWRTIASEVIAEAQVLSQCQRDMEHCANPAAREYLTLINESRALPDRAKIDRINRAINAAVRYTSDQDQYGVPDLWTAPLATLGSGQGDCEDYAIAKYVALRDSGFSADDLRLLIVRDRVARQDHAVVGVRQNGRWLMLDNRHEILLERKDAWHFTPLFALDQEGVKLFAAPYDKPPATVPALVASNPADTTEPASAKEPIPPSAEALGLRLDTFDPPQLRSGL